MATVKLGINTCFAIKRYSEPEEWTRIIGEELEVRYAQFSADLLDPFVPEQVKEEICRRTKQAAARYNVSLHSVFSGVGVQAGNLLLHWDAGMRHHALNWYKKLVDIAKFLGAKACGGILGSHTFAQIVNQEKEREIRHSLVEQWKELAEHAAQAGMEYLVAEVMSVRREMPSGMEETERLYADFNAGAPLPTYLCLDFGHILAETGTPADRDPYAWIRRFGSRCPVMHAQQTDGKQSRHWPFTPEYNKAGIIKAEKILEAIEKSGAEEVVLMLEIFHPNFEPYDTQVVDDLKTSVQYWRKYVPK